MPGALIAAFVAMRRVWRWFEWRFTPAGLVVLAGVPVSLGIANPEQTAGLPVFLLLSALLAAALAWAPLFRVRLAVQRSAPALAVAGEPFPLRVRLVNRGRRRERGLEYGEVLREAAIDAGALARRLRRLGARSPAARLEAAALALRDVRSPVVALPDLAPGAVCEVTLAITAFRRGPLRLAAGRALRSDPCGLFRAEARLAAADTVLVLPRRHPLPPLSLPGRRHAQGGGVPLAFGVGESEEFVALRDYRRGDSLRRVHWRSSSRTGRLVVKEFHDEHIVRHALVLDTCAGADADGCFEAAVAVAASFVATVQHPDSLLDLLFVGPQAVCLTSGRGVGQERQMLEALATVQPCAAARLGELEDAVGAHLRGLVGAILVLTAWDEPRRALARRLARRGLPLWVLVLAHPGGAPPPAPEPGGPRRLAFIDPQRIADGLQQLAGWS